MRDPSRLALALSGVVALASCAARGSGPTSSNAPNTGLNALTQSVDAPDQPVAGDLSSPGPADPQAERPRTRLEKLAAHTHVDLDDIFATTTPSKPASGGTPELVAPAPAAAETGGTSAIADTSGLATLPESAPNAGLSALTGEDAATPAPNSTAEATDSTTAKEREAQATRLASLRRELAVFLEARRQQGAKSMADAAAIVVGDAIGYDGDPKPSAPDESAFTSQERTTLTAIRALGRALSQGGKVDDPARAVQLVEGVLSTLREAAAVRIARTALCTRVEGFGQYQPFPEYTFLAGRATKMIVYTEIENFSHRAAHSGDPGADTLAGSDLLAVELSQELRLWHDADGSMQWRMPEQPIVEVGRHKRRDFFLVQQIELPPTLSVGKYNLKITIRDKVSGGVDERSIPIKIVADPGVIGRK